jgi:hypothetical protein
MNKFPYHYQPGHFDQFDPIVLRGQAIVPGSMVRVTRQYRAPMTPTIFKTIIDAKGNVQNVFKQALTRRGTNNED